MTSLSAFDTIVEKVCAVWPQHRRFLGMGRGHTDATAEKVAQVVLRLAGDDLERFIEGYRWTCAMMLEEELHFRRAGSYRLSSFAEVDDAVYQSAEVMGRYMDGLLLSQVLWPNHVRVFEFYLNHFLAKVASSRRHLEVGPGHGLLLYHATQVLSGSLEAWDISPSALQRTAECLQTLDSAAHVRLCCRDITTGVDDNSERFDSIVISEVLEHLEDPETVLRAVTNLLDKDGLIFINVPVNSPAIDHIFLFKTPEEVADLTKKVGLTIKDMCIAPAAGYSEAVARKAQTTMSCAIVAARAGLDLN